MKQRLDSIKRYAAQTLAVAAALGFAVPAANATDLSGVISVNGVETAGVVIVAYDCDTLVLLGITNTGPTELTDGVAHNYNFSVASEHVRLDLFFQDDPTDVFLADYCRSFVVCGQIDPVDGNATVNFDMPCVLIHGPGAASPGFWKNQPAAWPVEAIVIGGITYARADAIAFMKQADRGNKTKTLFRQLVSARLNVILGNDDTCIAAEIAAADAWMSAHPVGSLVTGASSAWQEIQAVAAKLGEYNLGLLCAPSRE